MNNLLLNTSTVLGLSSAIALAGVGLNNSQLATTAINIAISGAAISSVSKKTKQQQQSDRQTREYFGNIARQVNNINSEVQQQNNQIDLIQEYLQTNQNQTAQQQARLWFQFGELRKNLEQQKSDIATMHVENQHAIEQQKELNKKVDRTQLQLNNHNKKIKQQEHDINTQKSNHNKIYSELQKTKNQQQKLADANTKHNKQVAEKVDLLIELAQNNSQASSPRTSPKKNAPILARKPINRVYIDNNNLYNCSKALDIELDYQALMVKLTAATEKTIIKLYGGAFPHQQDKYILLKKLGYQVFTLPISKRGKGKFKTIGDDVKLSIDMIQDVKEGDLVTLVAGDGDYKPAIKKVKQRNVKVTVIAKKNAVSRDLISLADRVIYLDDIVEDIAKYTKLFA